MPICTLIGEGAMTSQRPVPALVRQACALQTIRKAVYTAYTRDQTAIVKATQGVLRRRATCRRGLLHPVFRAFQILVFRR
jgi:hypothetical protein